MESVHASPPGHGKTRDPHATHGRQQEAASAQHQATPRHKPRATLVRVPGWLIANGSDKTPPPTMVATLQRRPRGPKLSSQPGKRWRKASRCSASSCRGPKSSSAFHRRRRGPGIPTAADPWGTRTTAGTRWKRLAATSGHLSHRPRSIKGSLRSPCRAPDKQKSLFPSSERLPGLGSRQPSEASCRRTVGSQSAPDSQLRSTRPSASSLRRSHSNAFSKGTLS